MSRPGLVRDKREVGMPPRMDAIVEATNPKAIYYIFNYIYKNIRIEREKKGERGEGG